MKKELISTIFEAPIGRLQLIAERGKLIRILLPNSNDRSIDDVQIVKSAPDDSSFKGVVDFLSQYFKGEKFVWHGMDIPDGSVFFRKVWKAAAEIPSGETISYSELARRAGNPKAARAAGSAMAKNPLPILIPCHRVIAADGSLGGYGGGLDMKRWLLRHEGVRL